MQIKLHISNQALAEKKLMDCKNKNMNSKESKILIVHYLKVHTMKSEFKLNHIC